ncbi:MAG: hypothetical protein RBT66_07780 [bacterium]|jgi:hypothetical protein|nr:hypothetical protein [bacterium]
MMQDVMVDVLRLLREIGARVPAGSEVCFALHPDGLALTITGADPDGDDVPAVTRVFTERELRYGSTSERYLIGRVVAEFNALSPADPEQESGKKSGKKQNQ